MKNSDSNNIILTGGVVDFDKFVQNAHVKVKKDTIVNAINNHNNMNLSFEVAAYTSLTLNTFDYSLDLKTKLDIVLDDGASFIYNNAFIAEQKYDLDIKVHMYGDDTYSEINVRGLNEPGGTTKITASGTIAGGTKGNEINEYAKVINKSDSSCVLVPNLIVNTDEVIANHGVSISPLDEDELFYLLAKGLDKDHASKIIEEGFLLSIMDDDIKAKIKNILIGR